MFHRVHLLPALLLACIHGHNPCVASVEAGVTFSRGDRNGYLSAQGVSETNAPPLDPSHFKLLRKQLANPTIPTEVTHDDPEKCKLYLAESSIPNAGLGLYTTIPYQRHQTIGHSEIGILLHDRWFHDPKSLTTEQLIGHYAWGPDRLSYGKFEAGRSGVLLSGIGMACNDMPTASNVWQAPILSLSKFWEDGTDTLAEEGSKHETLQDVGRGSSSWHSGIRFQSMRELQAGEELFIGYGSGWFEARKDMVGPIPQKQHYESAYKILKQFWGNAEKDGLGLESPALQKRYEDRILKADWMRDMLRLALPQNATDIPTVLQIGAAKFAMKDFNSKRSVDWLKKNGVCVDNIVSGTSTIPQAGRGAFAARTIKEGGIIATTPVVSLDLDQIKLREEVLGSDGNNYIIHGGFQLVMNYCYGHDKSTLIFLPTMPAVSFINHGSKEDANAEVRWSTSPHHKSEWLDSPLEIMKQRQKSGLLFDIVATKEIKRGDEVLLYYGKEWEDSWNTHIDNWGKKSNFTEKNGIPTAADYNQIGKDSTVRTIWEQKIDPYPEHLMTTCFFIPPESCRAPSDKSQDVKCEVRSNYTFGMDQAYLHPCDIISRSSDGKGGHWYTAKVGIPKNDAMNHNLKENSGKPPAPGAASKSASEYYLVEYMPRYAIRIVDKPYTKDQFRKGAFRQFIGIGKGMMPDEWMDLQ
ncbi:hypothetical protein HJC23_010483 [Cyclotella cryptica]|uniref:SET domain-containing protein n=1 Tax=Cyclotella cryptica TaxID=29204 RepID=A0ABD3QB99_9STRA|eukprot:CCRYP_007049-RA/>CCRYP_007049-RA protein AED:0.32 eAED:0.32 QI:0/-1/0/1/-1/1/1/0/692